MGHLNANPETTRVSVPGIVLARWNCSAREWQQFLYWSDVRGHQQRTCREALAVLTAGIFLLHFVMAVNWLPTLLIWLPVAFCYWRFRCSAKGAAVMMKPAKDTVIIISTQAVQLNGQVQVFADTLHTLKNIQVLETTTPKVLEITCGPVVENPTAVQKIRVPIPTGRLGDAVRLLTILEGYLPSPASPK